MAEKKIKLRLDDIKVDSFVTDLDGVTSGGALAVTTVQLGSAVLGCVMHTINVIECNPSLNIMQCSHYPCTAAAGGCTASWDGCNTREGAGACK